MDVYAASDGSVVRLDHGLAEFESIEQLYAEVSASSNVEASNILMFLADGRELKHDILQQAWDRGGEAGTSSNRTIAYLFDRETFFVDAEISAAKYAEEIQLPPQLPLSAIHDVNLVQDPFILASDHIQHLQSLFTAQSNALSIAYANLFYHLNPFIQEFERFAPKAEQELEVEDELIRSAPGDMAMLTRVVIHDQLKRDRDKEKTVMADWVNPKKMEQVRDNCRLAHESHVARYNSLVTAVEELTTTCDAERRAAEERTTAVASDFSEGLGRIELALSQVEALVAGGVDGAIQDLVELDRGMREDLIALTNLKNDFTLDLHVHLCQIANLQIQFVSLTPQVNEIEADVMSNSSSSKAAFPHLRRLRNLPFAYAATVVEVVRRKEFGQFLDEWTGRLRETLLKFTATENVKRQQVREEILSQLPFAVPVLEDSTKIGVDMTVTTGLEALKNVQMDRNDIEDLIRWIESIKHDPDILSVVETGDKGPIQFLQTRMETLIATMDATSSGLDRMIQDSVLSRSSAELRASQTLSAQLRAVEREKAQHEQQIAELQAAHRQEVNGIHDRHERSTEALQLRQGELQEELVRVRNDLEDEMLARQALSAQLEENTRDQENRQREQEDHNELVTALQAEVAQEKDRAIDLGVRLQEALLDVDGYRNAEQNLQCKILALQEERSRSARAISDAQNQAKAVETQIAGLKAELESTTAQLTQAQAERDTALKNQSAEAERMMRDQIAEADGDRAVLEHQNLNLTKQLEDVRQEMQDKLAAARNQAIRQADGLKAELQFTKAQLRTSQQKETVLADELAMTKDRAEQSETHAVRQHVIAKDAVGLVGLYHETCMKLLNTINASSSISGSSSTLINKPAREETKTEHVVDNGDSKDSAALTSSLAVAQAFDLVVFTEAVQKTINLVRKYVKSCKSYRDLARNRISFTNFAKGDLALFLPTRNAASKIWACFNVSAPHNFLQVSPSMQEQMATREWIIARIAKTEEAVATGGESPETNPFGLADGLRYWVHTVEEYNPVAIRPPRRSTSAIYHARAEDTPGLNDATPQRIPADTPSRVPPITADPNSPLSPTKEVQPMAYFDLQPQRITSPVNNTQAFAAAGPEHLSPDAPTPPLAKSPQAVHQPPAPPNTGVTAPRDVPKLSPVRESLSQSGLGSGDPPSSTPLPASPETTTSRPHSRGHFRASSRLSSHPSRDHLPPLFAPATFGRPASVASNASYPGGAPFASGKSAPAMAITTSSPGGPGSTEGHGDLNPFMETTRARRKSSNHSLLAQDEIFRAGLRRNDSGEASPGSSGFQALSSVPSQPGASSIAQAGQTSQTATPSPGTSPGNGASRLMRGFSIRGKRSSTDQAATNVKPSAMDMLRRFEGSG